MTIPFIKTLVGRGAGLIPHRLPLPPPSSIRQLIPIPPPNTTTNEPQETKQTHNKLNPTYNVAAIHAPQYRSLLSFNTTIAPTMRRPHTSTISSGRWVPLCQPHYEFPFEFISTPFSEMLRATFFGGDEEDKSFEDIIRVNNAVVSEVLMCNVINRAYRLNNHRKFSNVPNNTKFGKQLKGRMKGISHRGNFIAFGTYALQALEPARITAKQVEAGRRAILRIARGGKIWVRIFADKPVTKKPAETRMGRGKGSVAYWAAVVQPGRLLYEIGGVTENIARQAISLASSKMHIRTRFLVSGSK